MVQRARPQDRLIARIESVLAGRPFVLAAWVSGSLAAGQADEHSDVDVAAGVRDESLGEPDETWRALADEVEHLVYCGVRRSHDGILVNAVTAGWERFDILLVPAARVASGVPGPIAVLFDRMGGVRQTAARRQPPSPARLRDVVDEFIRCLGLLGVVGPRQEWLAAMGGTLLMRQLLIELLLAENGEVIGVGSALRLNRRLADAQRELLLGLPPLAPTRDAILAHQLALANAFLPRARRLLSAYGVAFPVEFERATRDHLRRRLGVTL